MMARASVRITVFALALFWPWAASSQTDPAPPATSAEPADTVSPVMAPTVPLATPEATPQEPAVQVPPTPQKRPRAPYAIFQVLDKITAETIRFRVPVDGAVRFKSLVFQARACETAASDEPRADSLAYVTITSQPLSPQGALAAPIKEIYRGWMSATAPGLNPVQHPIYDVWLITCTTSEPVPVKR